LLEISGNFLTSYRAELYFMRVLKFIKSLLILCLVFVWSCNSTKYIPDGEYMLKKVEIQNTPKDISKDELKDYIRQHPNSTILGFFKLRLGLYNLSGRDTSKWWNRGFKRIGEEPVVYDELLRAKTNQQLQLFLNTKGYFNSNVEDFVHYSRRKKAKISFKINHGKRYEINEIHYRIPDDSIRTIVFQDTIKSLIKTGKAFDADLHDRERERITKLVRDQGYYDFVKEYIYFRADSSLNSYQVNDTLIIAKQKAYLEDGTSKLVDHKKSKIRDVYFLVGFDPQKRSNDNEYASKFDTLMYEGCYILYGKNLNFRADVLINSNYIFPGEFYNSKLVSKTQNLLSSLQLFRFINIRFNSVEGMDADGFKQLDCYIQLSPSKIQAYSVDVEGTNSSGNFGAAGSFSYKHKNLFRGAEVFDLRLRAATEAQTKTTGDEQERFNTLEVGADASLTLPSFLIPIRIEGFRKKYNPKTTISAAYNYQERPDYVRSLANARLSYGWKSSRFIRHYFSPIEFSLIDIPYKDPKFWESIQQTYLKYSYENHLISNTSYTLLYNDQVKTQSDHNWFLRWHVEPSGNILDGLVRLWDENGNYENREFLGIRYAQYFKTEVELRYHYRMNPVNSFAYRFFGGAGYPYGNFPVLPFEKRYFAGGANSLRAWPVRGIGPGNSEGLDSDYNNQTSDIRLEANAEYRFKLFWLLEGALFLDLGNIWSIRSQAKTRLAKEEELEDEGLFLYDRFYKQLAFNWGVGTRLDFKYFIFRIDMGVKIHDPSLPKADRWILGKRSYDFGTDTAINVAIGYPF